MVETTDGTLELALAVDGLNDDDIVLDPDSAAKAADSCTVVEAGAEGRFEESRLETIEEVEASTSVDVIAVLDCAVPSVSPTIVEDGTEDVAVNDAADGTSDARVELALYDTDEATFDTSRLTLSHVSCSRDTVSRQCIPLPTSPGDGRGGPRKQKDIENDGYLHFVDLFRMEKVETIGYDREKGSTR